eukprot:813929-Pleurochrysis_carterae.AAC.1
MDWARDLLAQCTSTHWRARFGLYLTLSEHVPTRQIRRITQACAAPAPTPLTLEFYFLQELLNEWEGSTYKSTLPNLTSLAAHYELERYGSGCDSVTESRGARRGSPWSSQNNYYRTTGLNNRAQCTRVRDAGRCSVANESNGRLNSRYQVRVSTASSVYVVCNGGT